MSSALESALEAVVMQAALDDHYARHPGARPDLGDLAVAAAELDEHPLAAEPDRLRQAAVEIAVRRPGHRLRTCCCGPRRGRLARWREPARAAGQRAMQALASPGHPKHRKVISIVQVVASRNQYLDYWTNLHYTAAPAREFRRGTHQRVEHLDMRVEFHRDKLPSRIWWAQWSGYLDVHRDIVEREEIALDEEHSTHR
jgi:hypothetical protein